MPAYYIGPKKREGVGPVDIHVYLLPHVMSFSETELELVQRHIQQGMKHVSRQRRIINELAGHKHPTDVAERILVSFEECLDAHRSHLDRLI